MGITVGGSSTGGVIWPVVLSQLLNEDGVSFGWTLRIVGFMMLQILFLAILTVRLPPRLQRQPEDQPEPENEGPRGKQHTLTHIKSIIKNTTFLTLCARPAICYLGMFSPFFYVSSYAHSLGHPTGFTFYIVSMVNAASLFGRTLPGFLADLYGHFDLCGLAALPSGVTAFCWTAAGSIAALVVWALAFGFSSGAIMSLQSACAAHLATHETHGTAVGFLVGSLPLSTLFGTPISGQLVESYGYLALAMYVGASLVVGSILIGWARLQYRTNPCLRTSTCDYCYLEYS